MTERWMRDQRPNMIPESRTSLQFVRITGGKLSSVGKMTRAFRAPLALTREQDVYIYRYECIRNGEIIILLRLMDD